MANIKGDLERHLKYLPEETANTDEFLEVLEKLFGIHRNILQNPTNEIYRRINKSNKDFNFIWKFEGIKLFFYNLGWRRDGDSMYLRTSENLRTALNTILDIRFPYYPIEPEKMPEVEPQRTNQIEANNNREVINIPQENIRQVQVIQEVPTPTENKESASDADTQSDIDSSSSDTDSDFNSDFDDFSNSDSDYIYSDSE